MEIYTRTRKYDKEAIERIQEKHRKEREEFDKKKAEKEKQDESYEASLKKKLDWYTYVEQNSKKKYKTLEESVGKSITEEEFDALAEKQDACYHKVKSRYKVWPSAYASGALVQCRKKGAKNWGNKSK